MNLAKQKREPKFKVSFNLGFRESLGIVLCAILFFVAPIALIEYTKQLNPALTETYTQSAIESAQGEGRVAGVATSINEKYFTIPFINFKFDTTLSESSSIFFLFGVMLFIGGVVLAISLFASSNKRLVVSKSY